MQYSLLRFAKQLIITVVSLTAEFWVVWLEGTAHSLHGVVMDGAKMLFVTTCKSQQHFPCSSATGWVCGHETGSGAIKKLYLNSYTKTFILEINEFHS